MKSIKIYKNIDNYPLFKSIEIKFICLAVPGLGLAILFKNLFTLNPLSDINILIFIIMNFFADFLSVVLPNGINVSLSFPIMFCALLLFGPVAAVWVYIPAALINMTLKKKEPFKIIYNISQVTISVFAAAYVLPDSFSYILISQHWFRLFIAVWMFDMVNFILVVKMVCFQTGRKFFSSFKEIWLHEMATVRPIYYAAGIIMAICFQAQGIWGAILVAAPILGVFFQLDTQKELKDQTCKANTDALTGLANRYALENWWKEKLPDIITNEKKLAVIMLDIDDFKQVNDLYGHEVGDLVLKDVACILRECVRRTDCIFRYGGEEFVILLPDTNINGAFQVADRIREKINSTIMPCIEKHTISISAGISFLTKRLIYEEENLMGELIRQADKAMYVAKQNGKNQVQVYN